MNVNEAIKKLKDYIFMSFEATRAKIGPNIYRGHLRSLSTDIEDGVAKLLIGILPEGYKVYVDSSVRVNDKTHRPDILIVDKKDCVRALVELKTNMGWCRNADEEINKIHTRHEKMAGKGNIHCEFSNYSGIDETSATYSSCVPVYLVAFTADNCSESKHDQNRKIAQQKDIKYYVLFKNWYNSLEDYEISQFTAEILRISEN